MHLTIKSSKDCLDKLGHFRESNLIKIVGPDGTGKSTFLSILYICLYKYCVENGFGFFPFYINLHYYDKIIADAEPNEAEVKERMCRDLDDLQRMVQDYPELSYIIIIDGNENYFRTTLKTAKYFRDYINKIDGHKKIVCIGEKTNLHTYSERNQHIFMQLRMEYIFKFKPIRNYEIENWEKFVTLFTSIQRNENFLKPVIAYLKKFNLDEIDLNILSVFKKCYDSDLMEGLKSVSDLYKKYCMSYLDDIDDFEDSAKMSYEYFMTNKKFTQKEIAQNNKEWNLIHQHKTSSNFLIAYYYIERLKDSSDKINIKELECVFPMDINIFIKPLINENLDTQKLILDKCKKLYIKGGLLAKSQVLYIMGRITHKSLKEEILSALEGYYQELYEKLPENRGQKTVQEEWDTYFLLRSVIISLVNLGKKDMRETYLGMLLNIPIANQINRSFHLEYYGDIQRTPDSNMYYYNDDGSEEMESTYSILSNRIMSYLSSAEGKEALNFQINLFTLCSLIQIRLRRNDLPEERIINLKNMITKTLEKEKNNLNKDLKAYLVMLEEDIEHNTFSPSYLYEKLYKVKDIVRSGWKKEIQAGSMEQPFENVVEHIYYTWMLGKIYLPDEPPKDSKYAMYDKNKILDVILIHDWAEVDVGDIVPEEDTKKHREEEDLRMRVLLMHDTYNQIGNMYQSKKMWKVYGKDSVDINGEIAYELDKIQAIYQFYVYLSKGARFTEEKMESWLNEKNMITTFIGQSILQEVVLDKFHRP